MSNMLRYFTKVGGVFSSVLSLTCSDIYFLHNLTLGVIISRSITHNHKTKTAIANTFCFSPFCHFSLRKISLVYSSPFLSLNISNFLVPLQFTAQIKLHYIDSIVFLSNLEHTPGNVLALIFRVYVI